MRSEIFGARGGRIIRSASLLLVFLFSGARVSAHVEKGAMPDSVAEMEYRILLEFNPGDTATRSLLGMTLLRQNKLAEAEKEFRKILEGDPKNFDALDGLGLTLFKQKRGSAALSHLLAAIKIRPNDIMIHLHLGQSLAADGQIEAARQTLATGLDLLNKQTASAVKEHQLTEFKAALAALPKKTANPTLQ